MKYPKSVEEAYEKEGPWKEAKAILRELVLASGMEETLKWGMPTYCVNNKNVAGVNGFRDWACLWFFQGALLADPEGKLVNAQEGTTKAMRQWRFGSVEEIRENADLIKAYLFEAIENQKAGKEIKANRNKPLVVPPELQAALDKDSGLQQKWETLNKTRKREYTDHISEAKRAETKQKRLEKILPMIAEGIGLHDKYRK